MRLNPGAASGCLQWPGWFLPTARNVAPRWAAGGSRDPQGGNFGAALIPEENFGTREQVQVKNVMLKRNDDWEPYQWELVILQGGDLQGPATSPRLPCAVHHGKHGNME